MATKNENKTLCRTPTPGGKPTRIPAWKYDTIAETIRAEIAAAGEHGMRFKDLPEAVAAHLDAEVAGRIGSIGWHVTTVKLEMEVRGEFVRRKSSDGQRLWLSC